MVNLKFHLDQTRGVSHCGLAISIKKYLKAKEELWKLKYFTRATILYNECKHNILALVGKANKGLKHYTHACSLLCHIITIDQVKGTLNKFRTKCGSSSFKNKKNPCNFSFLMGI
jgi:hypothetical protein